MLRLKLQLHESNYCRGFSEHAQWYHMNNVRVYIILPATPLSSNLRTSLRALLKFPYPVSASSKMGIDVASLMNSMTSTTWVHEASLLSRTPSWADMDKPLPQMPLKPLHKVKSFIPQVSDYQKQKFCQDPSDMQNFSLTRQRILTLSINRI